MNETTSTLTALGIISLLALAAVTILTGDMTLSNIFLTVFGGV